MDQIDAILRGEESVRDDVFCFNLLHFEVICSSHYKNEGGKSIDNAYDRKIRKQLYKLVT